ncbi:DUF771 domain-containing protein [Staphylococcus kloosii]|uniref:DUF771 domain-containing protein n=1 Tax=Staphylococcus kloosii TaxID=29384 RepID=UPI000D1E61B7|nr:DUF771 domain-containing protein [Staphylococcus kloosii]PTJ78829.1 DUF771 domain-containing protein [Staphylococcus kloosii]
MQEQTQGNETLVIINEPKLVWSFKDLQSHMQLSRNSIMKKFLLNPKFKKDIEKYVHEPNSQADHYKFLAEPIKEYIKKNFNEIYNS